MKIASSGEGIILKFLNIYFLVTLSHVDEVFFVLVENILLAGGLEAWFGYFPKVVYVHLLKMFFDFPVDSYFQSFYYL